LSALGVIVNPVSGQDIRRLESPTPVQTVLGKTQLVAQVLGVAAGLGVREVFVPADGYGIAANLAAMGLGLELHIVPMPLTYTAEDTFEAVQRLEPLVSLLVVVGGDGTLRQVAKAQPKCPILPLPSGTNNAFAHRVGGTHTGIVAGLLALGQLESTRCCYRAKWLRIRYDGGEDLALVDAVISRNPNLGSKALLEPDELECAALSFAEPWSLGIASIGAAINPCGREEDWGIWLEFSPQAPTVLAPILPGRLLSVAVASCSRLDLGQPRRHFVSSGTLALDGEREVELRQTWVEFTLENAPLEVIDPERALVEALRKVNSPDG